MTNREKYAKSTLDETLEAFKAHPDYVCGLMPMFQSGASDNLAVYLIPFYNSIQVMTATFAHEMTWTPVAITLAANVVYTGIAVWGLTKMFNSEKVMFSK